MKCYEKVELEIADVPVGETRQFPGGVSVEHRYRDRYHVLFTGPPGSHPNVRDGVAAWVEWRLAKTIRTAAKHVCSFMQNPPHLRRR